MLDGSDIVDVARAATQRIMAVTIAVGTRLPVHATAMGRVLLSTRPEPEWVPTLEATGLPALTPRTLTELDVLVAELRGTLRRGWAEVDGELEPGLRSVAVPVHGQHGVVAAINVAMPSPATRNDEGAPTLAGALEETARAIENDLRAVALRSAP